MNAMKKMLCAALALTSVLSLAACGQSATTGSSQEEGQGVTYKIGISQYGEHASLDNCREGFLEGLRQAGLVEGENLEVMYENAHFDDDMTAQIGETFSAADVDLMVGIATPSAVACYNAAEDKDIPVIFTAITDPVGAHLDSGNITGTSDVLPVEGQLQLIRALQPEADTIGIIYTTSEPNSVYSVGVYEEMAGDYGFTIESIGVAAQEEVTQAARHPAVPGRGLPVQPDGQQRGGRAAGHSGKDRRGGHPRLWLRDRAGEKRLRGRRGPGLCPAGHPDGPDGRQDPQGRSRLPGPAL